MGSCVSGYNKISMKSSVLQHSQPFKNTLNHLYFGHGKYQTEEEFLQFATATCFKNKVKFFKTKSDFAIIAANGLIADHEERSAGAHWLHSGKREELDWNFITKVRTIFNDLGIKPIGMKNP